MFIEQSSMKPAAHLARRPSIRNLVSNEPRRHQQPSTVLRRQESQRSTEEIIVDRRPHRPKDIPEVVNTVVLKKKPSPITIITRKTSMKQEEQNVYETPQSDQMQVSVSNSQVSNKRRPSNATSVGSRGTNGNKQMSKQILHAIMNSMNNNQDGLPATTEDFFDKGPLSNPEETISNITDSS